MGQHRRTSFDDMTKLFEMPFGDYQTSFSSNVFATENQQNSPVLSLSMDNLLNDDYLSFLTTNPAMTATTTTTTAIENIKTIDNNAAKSAFYTYNPQNLVPFIPQQMSVSPCYATTTFGHTFNLPTPTNTSIKTFFFDTDRDGIISTNSGISRSNSQPDLTASEKTPTQLGLNKMKTRRHPSFSFKSSMSECSEDFYVDLNTTTTTTTDDGIFLGTDAISDFLSGCSFSDILDDLPDLEELMSVVTFDSTTSWSKQTHCDINLDDGMTNSNVSSLTNELANESRISRSAPPSPTPLRNGPGGNSAKKRNLPWHKAWTRMNNEEQMTIVETLTRIVNDEMGLREQLEIIRILNTDAKLLPTDRQFIIDLNMIDDEKFRRLKEVIKMHGLKLNEISKQEKQISDNWSECSAISCPQGNNKLIKRELRLRRAQQRLIKHTQRKETRQILKESKSGLFIKTEVIPLSQVLPEEEVDDVDILS